MTYQSCYLTPCAPPSDAELVAITTLLYEDAGIVIAPGKGSMVQSRLAKRLRALGLDSYKKYLELVCSDAGADERRRMISALTTNVTHFFRENHHFEILRDEALPELIQQARTGSRIRIWSAGSSNGQEAYSIAMVIAELATDFQTLDIRILATDIDPEMIKRGMDGTYDKNTVEAVPNHLRVKYFEPAGEDLRLIAPLRELVSFRELNLHHSWPMKGRFDIIFCRNVVIYFDLAAQIALWKRFEQALAPAGWILVGHSERIPTEDGSKLITAGITTYRLPKTGNVQGESAWH
jgi:chemotaxis protein methyltransferase CheR